MKKAVVCLSGGLDSSTCLAVAQDQGYTCYALSFDYDQKHSVELKAAKRVADHFKVAMHKTVNLRDIASLSDSALTNSDKHVPDFTGEEGLPVTYVPARNTIFLSIAMGWAESFNAEAIFIGACKEDDNNYPDCRPAFIDAFRHLMRNASDDCSSLQQCKLITPLMDLDKAETIKLGQILGVDYGLTISCYRADEQGRACGDCLSCQHRKAGFARANVDDVTVYVDDFVL